MHSAGQVQVLVSRKQISTKEQEEEKNQQSWRGEKQFPDKPDKGGGEGNILEKAKFYCCHTLTPLCQN